MAEHPELPAREAGWYPDPERAHTLRYWDGDSWTDDRAPDVPAAPQRVKAEDAGPSDSSATDAGGGLTLEGRDGIAILLAALGAIIAIVGTFLPLADTESSLHIAKNSLIQHWEGPVVIAIAIAGLLAALHPKTRPIAFLAGGALVGLAVVAGTDLPIEYRNEFSRAVAGDASPGAGVWTVGIGGAFLAVSALFADWGALSAGGDQSSRTPGPRMTRWEEIMSGREVQQEEAPAQAPSKGSRMRRFEEIMSGRKIPDPESDSELSD